MKEKELRVESEVSHDRAKPLRINVSVARLLRGSCVREGERKIPGQSGHAAHDQPFSEVPDSGIPQVSAHPSLSAWGLSEDLRIAINGNTQAWEYLRKMATL